MTKPEAAELPASLTEAFDKILISYDVFVRRQGHDGRLVDVCKSQSEWR
jgi:hypothetical protein